MLKIFTFFSVHYNEVIVVVAEDRTEAIAKLNEVYLPGCDTNDWIIGSSMNCTKGQTISVSIPKDGQVLALSNEASEIIFEKYLKE